MSDDSGKRPLWRFLAPPRSAAAAELAAVAGEKGGLRRAASVPSAGGANVPEAAPGRAGAPAASVAQAEYESFLAGGPAARADPGPPPAPGDAPGYIDWELCSGAAPVLHFGAAPHSRDIALAELADAERVREVFDAAWDDNETTVPRAAAPPLPPQAAAINPVRAQTHAEASADDGLAVAALLCAPADYSLERAWLDSAPPKANLQQNRVKRIIGGMEAEWEREVAQWTGARPAAAKASKL